MEEQSVPMPVRVCCFNRLMPTPRSIFYGAWGELDTHVVTKQPLGILKYSNAGHVPACFHVE